MSDTEKKKSIQEEATFRPHPLPRLKKPKLEIRSPPSPNGPEEASTKPWEAEVETAPNTASVQFLIASAKYRSKTTSETQQNEGHLNHSPDIKTQSIKPSPESQKDEAREIKPSELQNHLLKRKREKSVFVEKYHHCYVQTNYRNQSEEGRHRCRTCGNRATGGT